MKSLQFFTSIAITLVSLLPVSSRPATAAEPTAPVTPPAADRQIGLLFDPKNRPEPGDPDNLAYLVERKYTGQCSGNSEPEAVAHFFSKTRKPSSGLRVIVRNTTFGFGGDTRPNTDREYYSGDISEGFLVKYGNHHSNRYLAVQPGNNEFDYVIKSGQSILESGKFSVKVDRKIITEYRHSTASVESYCAYYHRGHCIYQTRTVYNCN
jgi:hypothetical protein